MTTMAQNYTFTAEQAATLLGCNHFSGAQVAAAVSESLLALGCGAAESQRQRLSATSQSAAQQAVHSLER